MGIQHGFRVLADALRGKRSGRASPPRLELESKPLRMSFIPLLVIGIPIALLLALQFRALDRFESRTAHVLREESEQLAEGLSQEIERELKKPIFNFLEQVDHVAVRRLDLAAIASDLRQHREDARFLRTFFVWSRIASVAGAPAGEVLFYDLRKAELASLPGEAHEGFSIDPVLSAKLLERVKEFSILGSSYGLLFETHENESQDIVYHLLFDLPESNNLEAFMGFIAYPGEIVESVFPELLTRARGQASAPTDPGLASVSVFDEGGSEVFRTGASLRERYEHEVELPFFFFDVDLIKSFRWFTPQVRYWKVRSGYSMGSASDIARGQVNQQRTLLVLVSIVALIGLLLTVRATVRETRLAELRTDFIASVSHELKTPLASVKMFAEMLRTGRATSPEKTRQYLDIIGRETGRLEQILEGILDFQRIRDDRAQYPLAPVDLGPVVRDVVAGFDHQLGIDGFRTRIQVDEPVAVLGNHQALVQVLRNLVSNAIKYSPEEKSLELKVFRDAGSGVFEVIDRGAGIPAREQRRIFKKFYRLVPARMESATGTGIGLSIVAHLVRAMQGRVSVASHPGEGSTFRVELPLANGVVIHEDHSHR